MKRMRLALAFCCLLAGAQIREGDGMKLAARLTLDAEPRMPVRVYLWKDGRPLRLAVKSGQG